LERQNSRLGRLIAATPINLQREANGQLSHRLRLRKSTAAGSNVTARNGMWSGLQGAVDLTKVFTNATPGSGTT